MSEDPDASQVAAALRASIGLLLRRLRQVRVEGEPTLPENSALVRLDRGGPATPSALARLEQISPQSMGATLAALEARGLVERLDLPPPADGRTHVVECSSYQIDLAPSLAPTVGLLINITPDHLDRHGDLAHYAAIKERLVAQSAIALVGVDDDLCRAICARLKAQSGGPRVVAVSGEESPLADVFVRDRRVVARDDAEGSVDLAGARALRGAHNGQNAAFAYAAARALGVAGRTIAEAFRSFPGLAHRMEEVGRRGRVLFINDSKATNADAAEKALESFRDIHWILGGKPKQGGIEPLRPLFPRVAKAYLIGEAAEAFARTLAGALPFERCGTLSAATAAAARDALRSAADEPVVLLSPACASFDQFANFEARGDAFRVAVAELMRGDA